MDLAAIASRTGLDAQELRITPLSGGVSSEVFLLEAGARRVVVKQSIPKLRVEAEWFSDCSRIWREIDVLKALDLPEGSVPRVLYEDRENYCFAMTAAAPGSEDWRTVLLRGQVDPRAARRAGEIHREWLRFDASLSVSLGFDDLTRFEELRIDPYYAFTSERHPDVAAAFEHAAQCCRARRLGLVHGDWSPKNIMVGPGGEVMALDWECVHLGDPGFDRAFLVNHFLLKAWHRPHDWALLRDCAVEYCAAAGWDGVEDHLGCLHLARVDGKSPAGYLDQEARGRVRIFAKQLIAHPPSGPRDLFERLR